MKLQRTTIILIVLTFGFGIFVYLTEIKGKENLDSTQEEVEKPKQLLVNFSKNDIKSLTIETQGKTLEFIKTEEQILPWKMIKPEEFKANDASISFLTNLFVTSKINQSFSISKNQLKDYGLDKPIAKIFVTLNNQDKYNLILGKTNFDDSLIYAQIDENKPDNENIKIALISKSFLYAVQRDFDDWKQIDINEDDNNKKEEKSPQN